MRQAKRILKCLLLSLFIVSNAFAYTPKASQIDVIDASNKYTSTTVEGALQEIANSPSFSILDQDITNWEYAYTHSGYVGTKQVDETNIGNDKILKYDYTSGKVVYVNLSSLPINEEDPIFLAWDRSTGISITESQISNLGDYVPYTGANKNVYLGTNKITTHGVDSTDDVSITSGKKIYTDSTKTSYHYTDASTGYTRFYYSNVEIMRFEH
jgi:hypothetical protein